ncbi:MAG: TonB-dependent receptor [Chitinophagaceae bacterium]
MFQRTINDFAAYVVAESATIMSLFSRIIIGIFSLCVSFSSLAQSGTIEGYIKDVDTKAPINGASINLKSDKAGDNTDAFGSFRFTDLAAGEYELIASHIGYRTEIVSIEVKPNLVSSVTVQMRKSDLDLSEVRVDTKKNIGLNTLSQVDIMLRPVNTSQDILRIVPGVFIAQHAGGGKAEQIFLRGYDIDHGTDINLSVDGMPVNMLSHAHGQGYADLHFVIPETIEKVTFEMGPYNAEKGNLATAGFVDFRTKDFISNNSIKAEAGDFNTQRYAGLFKLFNNESEKPKQQFYVASEYFTSDSYFDNPQNFHRFNVMGKYNAWFGNQSQLTVSLSTFDSKWDASGQVPDRAVKAGVIPRFGSIDNSEGGNTSRTNFNIRFNKQWNSNWKTTDQFYYINYHFNLYSDFTFFLKDPVHGDEINQRESRNIYGYTTTASKAWMLGNKKTVTDLGAGFRYDNINDIALNHVVKREFIESFEKGDINEGNAFAYWNQQLNLSNKFTIDGGFRYDFFTFGYRNSLAGETNFRHQTRGILSPKLNFSYSPSATVKLYLNNGVGFHSNDTRVILNNEAKNILPKVYGTDLGIIIKPIRKLVLKTTLWHLYSEQEFVYVGDEGVVEPSGKTRRMGIDFSARYQVLSWLFADADVNLTRARAIGEAKGENYVPLAPSFTSIGGLTVKLKDGLHGSLRYRFIDHRPANEDYSITAQGYFITDVVIGYHWKSFDVFASVENAFNRKWREAQFDTESRLQNEPDAISEIHYTPGTPRYLKGGVSFSF